MFENFDKVNQQNILIIGDIILDKYIYGKTNRISPEAPVPVVLAENENNILGGAANVANNLKALGAQTFLIGCVGKDKNGSLVQKLANEYLSNSDGIFISDKITTTKTRIVSKGQQLLRIDDEDISYLKESEEEALLALIRKKLENVKFNGIVLQDYNKGLFSENMIDQVLEISKRMKLPVFVDPKHKNFWKYKNVTIFKPNLSEIIAANHELEDKSIDELIEITYKKLGCDILMCTLAERGIVFIENGKVTKTPTQKIDVVDVSGAGDSALSLIVLSYLLGYDTNTISKIANVGGKIACMKSGVGTINLNELKSTFKSVY